MSNPFQILANFLERFGDEVEGRELSQLPEDVKKRMEDFAAGRLPEEERTELVGLLHQNPHWVPRLAEAVKQLRTAKGG